MKDDFWKSQWQGFKEFLRWDCLLFEVILFSVCILIWGWWGIIPFLLVSSFFTANGGSWIDLNVYPDKEYPPNTCSAGIKDCIICEKTYIHDHEFNVEYNEKYNKWYDRIF